MKRIKLKHKILLILLGLLVAFILLESAMFFLNIMTTKKNKEYPNTKKKENVIRVLCAGDSYTYGIGAEKEHSYPEQMESILNQKSKDNKFEVINFGVPGNNSSQILKRIKLKSEKYNPDIIVVICGDNDSWNFVDSESKINRYFLVRIFSKTRLYKMFSVILTNAQGNIVDSKKTLKVNGFARNRLNQESRVPELIKYANTYRNFGYYKTARLFYEKALKKDFNSKMLYLELARCYKLEKNYGNAIESLEYLLNIYPDDAALHDELKDVFIVKNIIEETILFYEEFLKKFPRNKFANKELFNAYVHKAGIYLKKQELKEAEVFYEKALDVAENNLINEKRENLALILESIKKQAIIKRELSSRSIIHRIFTLQLANANKDEDFLSNLLEENLSEMIYFCKQNKTRIILSGYPEHTSKSMQKVAFKNKVELIMNENHFIAALTKFEDKDLFVSEQDRHCTALGYRLVAENIADVILKDY